MARKKSKSLKKRSGKSRKRSLRKKKSGRKKSITLRTKQSKRKIRSRLKKKSKKCTPKKKIYCGNNSLHKSLSNGFVVGTRYECFRKGVGVGLNMPLDEDYNQPYEKIDKTRIYCGGKELPVGYDRFGTTGECLRKGVGVGKLKIARKV